MSVPEDNRNISGYHGLRVELDISIQESKEFKFWIFYYRH